MCNLCPENQALIVMKAVILSLLAIAAEQAASHATFQALWVDGVDVISLRLFEVSKRGADL